MQSRSVILISVLVNLFFSYLMLLYNQPINPDGILYIHAAQAYIQNGLHGTLSVYSWPFYSVLLAKTSQLFHLSLLNTGYLLNSLFTSILVLFFILTVKLLENSPKALLWAAAVILLFPALNHDRYLLVRDIGYYAFFMASLWGYIKFLQTEKIKYALIFTLTIILATAFRIEGAVFLVLMPLITLILKCDFKLILINTVLFLLGLFCFRHTLNFGRIPEIISDMTPSQFFTLFQNNVTNLKQYLGVVGQDDAGVFLISGLAGILIISFLTTFGFFSSLLLGYGIYKKSIAQNKSALHGLVIYILINIFILSVFLAHQLFMNWRYIFPLALVCLLFIPGILARLDKRWIAVIYLLLNTTASFGQFGPSNAYIVEAGNWVANNTDKTTKIYSADKTITFYANREESDNINKANYVIIISKTHTPAQIPFTKNPVASFHNHRGDTAYIYKNN
jgi:hypothetical protein